MARMVIDIRINNEAFAESAAMECARILREQADRLEAGLGFSESISDINGNTVSKASFIRGRK